MKAIRSARKIGTKINFLVGMMFIISLVSVTFTCISIFQRLIMDMLETECVNGTNVLSYTLSASSSQTDITQLLDQLKEQMGCEFTIFDGNTRVNTTIIQNGQRAVGTKLSSELSQRLLVEGRSFVGKAPILGIPHLCSYVPIKGADGQVSGVLFAGISMHQATTNLRQSIIITCLTGALFLLSGLTLLYFFIKKSVSDPLNRLTVFARTISSGDLGISSNSKLDAHIHSQDEIGILANTFEHTMELLKGYISEIATVLGTIAKGDLTVWTTMDYIGDFVSIKNSLNEITRSLNSTMRQIMTASEEVSSRSGLVSDGARSLSQGAVQQASSVEELASTISRLSEQVNVNAENARNASLSAVQTGQDIYESDQRMREMLRAMEEINTSSDKIKQIVKTIEDIAFQTNILALNAAVEAARAGEAGKGFAVVADEVRNLASKSSEASKDTVALIEESIQAVAKGTQIADETARMLLEVVEKSKSVSRNIDEISSASHQQAASIHQVTQGVNQISMVIQATSATAEESAATSQELSGQAHLLKNLVAHFQLNDSIGSDTLGYR